jgi:5-(carboxyamino)imidazole ribonucleotide synthase
MPEQLERPRHIPRGSTIGMVGGGQLGRMAAMAAARLGYHVHVYSQEPTGPTEQVCHAATIAEFDDEDALGEFAEHVDVVTFEWENVPVRTLKFLARLHPVRPSWEIQEMAQDRAAEKFFINESGIATTEWHEVETLEELEDAVDDLGTPCVIKSARFGYDGKGQVTIESPEDVESAWNDVGEVRSVVEAFVDYEMEMSTIVARSPTGQIAVYDAVENHHVEHVLDSTYAPASAELNACSRAADIAVTLAEKLELEGVLAIEYFLTRDGALLVNEVAPRPHNSGHWTIDACNTSQFEQFIRAVCNLPLGSPRRHSNAIMQNLLGPIGERWLETLKDPEAKLHLYGKADAYAGRKMGHVTRLTDLSDKHVSDIS